MNEYAYTALATVSETPYRVGAVYDIDDSIMMVDWSQQSLADFPWLAFLKEETVLSLSEDKAISGLHIDTLNHKVKILVSDAPGFHILSESSVLGVFQGGEEQEWNKLPESLDWLYGDKPYITTVDILPILDSLRDALSNYEAIDGLSDYINSHSYNQPSSLSSYASYSNLELDKLVPHGLPSYVDMNLGVEKTYEEIDIEFTETDGEFILEDHPPSEIQILLTQQIGDYISSQVIRISSDYTMIKKIYLSTNTDISNYFETDLVSTVSFQVSINRAYNETTQLPFQLDDSIIRCDRDVPSSVLTSDSGILGSISLELRTPTQVIPHSTASGPLSTSTILFDGVATNTEFIDNSIIYMEYTVISL